MVRKLKELAKRRQNSSSSDGIAESDVRDARDALLRSSLLGIDVIDELVLVLVLMRLRFLI